MMFPAQKGLYGNYYFHEDTPKEVKDILAAEMDKNDREKKRRLRIWYGDSTTGEAWHEEYDIMGTIGRSTGTRKAPLMIANARSLGGPALLDHCIVRIDEVSTKNTLYRHPFFNVPLELKEDFTPYQINDFLVKAEVVDTFKREVVARFDCEQKALNWLNFMRGKRYRK